MAILASKFLRKVLVTTWVTSDGIWDLSIKEASFHQFGQEMDDQSGWVCAVVEYENGIVESVPLSSIRFIDHN